MIMARRKAGDTDPILRKVREEGEVLGNRISQVNLDRPFREKKPGPETITQDPNDLVKAVKDPAIEKQWTVFFQDELICAVVLRDIDEVRKVLATYNDVNKKEQFNRTALHHAMRRNDAYEVVKMLLEKGADPRLKDEFGHRPYDYSASKRVRELLVLYGSPEDSI
jgi:ankyrin repeat protein